MTGAALARLTIKVLAPLLGADRAQRATAQAYAVAYLVFYYVTIQYARAALGILWVVLTPVTFLAIYLPVLTYVFKADLPNATGPYDYALFMVGGFLPWGAFADSVGQGSGSIAQNAGIVRHAPMPPALLPVVKVTGSFLGLVIGVVVYAIVLAAVGRFPGVRLVLLPVALVLYYAFTLGVTWFLASASVFARDLVQLIPTFLLVEFFACPIVYHPDMAPGPLGGVVRWNPLTPFLALFRAALAPTAAFAWGDLALAGAWALVAFAVGTFTFKKLEDGFTDAL